MSRESKMSCLSSTTISTNLNLRTLCDSRHSTLIRYVMQVAVNRTPRTNSFMRLSLCHRCLQHHLIVTTIAYLMMNPESVKLEAIRWDQLSSLPISVSAVHKSILSMVMVMLVVMWVVDRIEVDILRYRSKEVTRRQSIIETCPKHRKYNIVKTITHHM